jgi:hypothetical protein
MMQPSFILKMAAVANWLGVLILSKFLTNHHAFGVIDPLFSLTGLILILVWGLAFWSVSLNPQGMRPFVAGFLCGKTGLCCEPRHLVFQGRASYRAFRAGSYAGPILQRLWD